MDFDIGLIISEFGETLQASRTDVQISWKERPANPTIDPVTRSKTGTPVIKTQLARGFIHFPEPRANSQVVQFQEIELGDCIVDFGQDVELDGKEGLMFLFLDHAGNPVDGQVWVPKPTSERLARTWGMIVAGVKIWRPVLLRKQT